MAAFAEAAACVPRVVQQALEAQKMWDTVRLATLTDVSAEELSSWAGELGCEVGGGADKGDISTLTDHHTPGGDSGDGVGWGVEEKKY